MLEDGIHTLAYGHHAIPAVVQRMNPHAAAMPDEVITAAEAAARRIPLLRHPRLPAGVDPVATMQEAVRTRDALLAQSQTLALAQPVDADVPEPDLLDYVLAESN